MLRPGGHVLFSAHEGDRRDRARPVPRPAGAVRRHLLRARRARRRERGRGTHGRARRTSRPVSVGVRDHSALHRSDPASRPTEQQPAEVEQPSLGAVRFDVERDLSRRRPGPTRTTARTAPGQSGPPGRPSAVPVRVDTHGRVRSRTGRGRRGGQGAAGVTAGCACSPVTSGERERLIVPAIITTTAPAVERDRNRARRAERLAEQRDADDRGEHRVRDRERGQRRREVAGLERALVEDQPDDRHQRERVGLPRADHSGHAVSTERVDHGLGQCRRHRVGRAGREREAQRAHVRGRAPGEDRPRPPRSSRRSRTRSPTARSAPASRPRTAIQR